jgi:hypothetical protein
MSSTRSSGRIEAILVLLGVSVSACGESRTGAATGGGNGSGGGTFFVGGPGAPQCDGSSPRAPAPDAAPACTPPASAVSYQRDVSPLVSDCAGEICHGAWKYSELVLRPSTECCTLYLVLPGDPSNSYLVHKLEGRDLCWGDPMPLDHAPLSPASIRLVTDWICEGAPDN